MQHLRAPKIVERSATYIALLWNADADAARCLPTDDTPGMLLDVEQPAKKGKGGNDDGADVLVVVRGLASGTSCRGVALRCRATGLWSRPSTPFHTLQLHAASRERARLVVDCRSAVPGADKARGSGGGGSSVFPTLHCGVCGKLKPLPLFPARERERATRGASDGHANNIEVTCKACHAVARSERQRTLLSLLAPPCSSLQCTLQLRRAMGSSSSGGGSDDSGNETTALAIAMRQLHAPHVPAVLREWIATGSSSLLRMPRDNVKPHALAAVGPAFAPWCGAERLPCALVRHVLGWLAPRDLLAAGLLCRQWQCQLLAVPRTAVLRLLARPPQPGEPDVAMGTGGAQAAVGLESQEMRRQRRRWRRRQRRRDAASAANTQVTSPQGTGCSAGRLLQLEPVSVPLLSTATRSAGSSRENSKCAPPSPPRKVEPRTTVVSTRTGAERMVNGRTQAKAQQQPQPPPPPPPPMQQQEHPEILKKTQVPLSSPCCVNAFPEDDSRPVGPG